MPTINLDKHFFINLFFGKTIRKIREWKIKRYKAKKVKSEAKNSPEKMYHLHFRLAIHNGAEKKLGDTIFDINIPANGYFYAKKKLERFIVANIDVEIVDFKTIEEEPQEEKKEETWQQIREKSNS